MSTQTQHIRFETIATVLESHSGPTTEGMGLTQTSGDSCLYVRQDSEGETFVVAVYMDDIILGGKGEAKLNAVKEELCGTLLICLSKNHSVHSRTKHIDIKYHYVRDMVQAGRIQLEYCASENMIADILTKGVTIKQFQKFRKLTGIEELDW